MKASPIPSPLSVPPVFLVVFLALTASVTFGKTVAEWKFDTQADSTGGSVVKLDQSRDGASDESLLSENATVASVATGISDKWQPFLASGYLEAKAGGGIPASGIVEINKYGLFTQPNPSDANNAGYANYFGFAGLGKGSNEEGREKGGTAYLVLSPLESFKPGARYGFVGTGHAADGEVQLVVEKSGELQLRIGGKATGTAVARLTREWNPGLWYLVAASWKTGGEPVLYVREMDATGASASPEATIGATEGVAPETNFPDADPLVVGSMWYNPGGNASTVYGAGSRIAYVRFDDSYSTREDIEAVFKSLAAP